MAPTPGDDKTEPSLELPSLRLPGLGRRKKEKQRGRRGIGSRTSQPAEPPAAEETRPEPQPVPEHRALPETEATQPILRQAPPGPEPTQEIPVEPEAVEHEPETPRAVPAPGVEKPRRKARRERRAQRKREARRDRKTRSLSRMPGRLAAVVTGVVVAVVGGAGTYGALATCEAVRGVSSCGGAPGFFILIAIVALMVVFGSLLLHLFGVTDPGSTSFLAVGVMAVVVMLALLPVMFSLWMLAVFPVLGAASYLLAHWVTTRFESDPTGRHDWM